MIILYNRHNHIFQNMFKQKFTTMVKQFKFLVKSDNESYFYTHYRQIENISIIVINHLN